MLTPAQTDEIRAFDSLVYAARERLYQAHETGGCQGYAPPPRDRGLDGLHVLPAIAGQITGISP